jgi:hypothetical protein
LAVLVMALAFASPPAADAVVYWGSGGSMGAANVDGSMPIISYPYGVANLPPEASVVGLAVNDTHLFWGDLSRPAIGSMALSGTPDGRVLLNEPRLWVDEALVPKVERPWGVAVDASHIYWASTAGAIGRSDLDGSAADRTFIGGLNTPCGIAVDNRYVYWGEIEIGTIGRARLDGTEVEPEFIADAGEPCGVAADSSHLYWSSPAGAIGRAGIDGSQPEPRFIAGAGSPCGVAVDQQHVYWANFAEPGTFVSRADLDGSNAAPLVGVPYYSAQCGVAVDSRVFQARPLPLSRPIRIGKVKRRKRGRLLVLSVYVPERGELVVTSPPAIGWRLDKGATPPAWRGGSFRWILKLWPGKGRIGKRIRRQIHNRHPAPVDLTFAWTEDARQPVTSRRHVVFRPTPRPRRHRK